MSILATSTQPPQSHADPLNSGDHAGPELVQLSAQTAQAVAPVLSPALATPPCTPPRASKSATPVFSPSIQASPFPTNPMHPYHDPVALVTTVSNRELRGFPGKQVHSLALTDSAVRYGKKLSEKTVADYVSKSRKQLELHPDQPPVPIELEPEVELTVEPDKITVHDKIRKRRKNYGLHRQPSGKKSPYPIDGDGIVRFVKGSKLEPGDLLRIRNQYKACLTGNPKEFIKRELEKLSQS